MKTALKISGLLIGFFLFLSITYKDKPFFNYVYDVISPATKYVQSATVGFFHRSVSNTQTYSKKLFDNSVPKMKDSVGSKFSAPKRTAGEPEEAITTDDKEELDALIKNH
jgi:hypothetical protein